MNTVEPKTELKQVKHTFTAEERVELNEQLLTALETQENTEAEFKQVKSQYNARLDEASARITGLRTNLRSGWEYRKQRCRVEFRPKDRKKDYYLEETGVIVLTEDMTQEDFQVDFLEDGGTNG